MDNEVKLTVLSVAYPFAPVSPDAVGGAEQILSRLDAALVSAGHRSLVVACEGSSVRGELLPVPPAVPRDGRATAAARAAHASAIREALRRFPVDLVHLHGVDFHTYLPPAGVPTLATLHLPTAWYPPEALQPRRPQTWLNCVSRSQAATLPPNPWMLEPIGNGVPCDPSPPRHAKRQFVLMLARVCPEKGVHLAIEAAKRAGIGLLIAGEVFPYSEHLAYFDQEVRPRLDRFRRFIGPAGAVRKRRLLAAARCVLVPSLVAETSSLAAREALAAGTPVIGFARGALAETIEHGRTGYLVQSVEEMAEAIAKLDRLEPETCREQARKRFGLRDMTDRYIASYQDLVRGAARAEGAA